MKRHFSQKNLSGKKIKHEFKKLVHQYDDEDYMDAFSETQQINSVETFKKKSGNKKVNQ
ncbi:hypothetical protein RCC89_10355 [Cytophagaceae bacterium ABcell3]|nr:hypothetical protein RCC89_10355 [Cytophagaceae bacterium ABcell3]